MDDINDAEPEATSSKRQRNKKKGTLAKLKEKRNRDFGSSASLGAETKTEANKLIDDLTVLNNSNRNSNSDNKQEFYTFSTKQGDKTDVQNEDVKPKPKPRFSSKSVNLIKDISEKQDDQREKIILLDDLEELKALNDDNKPDQTSVLQGSSFLPKPPLTPRTPKSTPRTPRGYVLPGKNDKQNQNAGSSGADTEGKQTNDLVDTKIDSAHKLSRQTPVQSGNRVMIRRASSQSLSKDNVIQDNKEMTVSKPPVMLTLATVSNGDSKFSDQLSNSMIPKEKYLKSSKKRKVKSNKNFDCNELSLQETKNSTNGESSNAVSKDNTDFHGNHEKLVLINVKDASKVSTPNTKTVPSPPSSMRLEPINNLHHPPPLTEDFLSKSMRTSYKIDANAKPGVAGPSEWATKKSDSCPDILSQRSFTSTSVLPLITTRDARSRMVPDTTIGTRVNSSLGSEELARYFPERKVNVFVGTWNMNELKDIKAPLEDFILPEKCDYVQDIYAIGTQENEVNRKEWELKLQELLIPSHVLYHSVSHGSLHLVIFIRRDLIWFCSSPEEDIISLRALAMVKTKGAIGISMKLFGTSYLFINCHLTSDRDNDTSRKKNRLENYFKVIQEMKLPKSAQTTTKRPGDVTAEFDCVFWFGDLNFRIERERKAVVGKVDEIALVETPNFETLLGGDQLLKFMSEDKIFGGFQEGRINFYPTFKFDLNADTYDSSSKSRVPSYTDRIVFRCKKKNDIHCLQYDAILSIKVSDHRPVFGQFETSISPGDENCVYYGGHFDRAIYTEALRRRENEKPEQKKTSSICLIQ